MEGLGRAPRRFPVLAHNPQHFSWDSEACAPVRPLGATRRLRPLSRDEGRCSIYSVINSAAASSFSPARARASLQLSYLNYVVPLFPPFLQ